MPQQPRYAVTLAALLLPLAAAAAMTPGMYEYTVKMSMPGPMTQAITAKRVGDCKP